MNFKEKYGEWALVAGGSEGMGGEYCSYLAGQGMNVAFTGRHPESVLKKGKQLEEEYGVQAKGIVMDMGALDALEQVKSATEGLEIGFLVYNAGIASIAPVQDRDIEYELYRFNVNSRSLLALTLWYSKEMVTRRKGAIILMASCGGIVGSPFIQTYSASKAYNFTLGEALWGELSEYGIEVLSVLPGNTIGQNFKEVPPGTPGFQTGREVVGEAFQNLGKVPAFIAGEYNRKTMGPFFNVEQRKEVILSVKQSLQAIAKQYGTGEDSK